MSKAKQTRDTTKGAKDAAADLAAQDALDLLSCIRADLTGVERFVEAELSALKDGRRISSKRLARLRLVAQDLDSAHRLAGRARRS